MSSLDSIADGVDEDSKVESFSLGGEARTDQQCNNRFELHTVSKLGEAYKMAFELVPYVNN